MRGARIPSRASTSYGRTEILPFDSAARACTPLESDAFPGRLRHRKPQNQTPRAATATGGYAGYEGTAQAPTPPNLRVACDKERTNQYRDLHPK